MQTLVSFVPYVVVVVGLVAFVGGRRCFRNPGTGFFTHPAVGIGAAAFLLAMFSPIALWFAGAPVAKAGGAGLAGGAGYLIVYLFCLVGALFLYAPLLAYHVTQLLSAALSTYADPEPDPEDPLERAQAAEERGHTVTAIERYQWLLEHDPSHVEARTRLAAIFATTGRIERAKKLIDEGLDLADLPPGTAAEWRALMLRLEEGGPDEAAPEGPVKEHRALGEITTPRIEVHETPSEGDIAAPELLEHEERDPVREDENEGGDAGEDAGGDAAGGDDVLRGPEWR